MNEIGRYALDRMLGSGAFATVWLARDEALEIDVAIKVLADNWSADAGVRERFLAEARLLRRISSPRVVRVYDVGVTGDQPYFVMDYLPHGTLADRRPERHAPGLALWLGAEAAFATQVLHDAGVLHRDLKPSNLLLGDSGERPRLLVADLGLAKAIAEGSGYTVTAGTPAYVAPEQARGEALDARADVYSLAVVTYELLSGRRPYAGTSLLDVVDRDPDRPPAPLAAELGVPDGVDAVLGAALATDRNLRPASAQSLGDELLRLVAEVEPREVAVGSEARPPSPPAWPTRVVVLLAALAFAGAATLAFFLSAP